MSRVWQKRAERGSQKWLQILVNRAPYLIDRAIAGKLGFASTEKITWLSPLTEDDYAEYRDEAFLSRLQVQAERTELRDFWPGRGPQWDGLGRTSRGEPLLIEAKAHIAELASPATAAGPQSRKVIARSLAMVKTGLGSRAAWDWCGSGYQYTNRLAHLYFLRKLNRIPAYLVFVSFLNADDVDGPETAEEWAGAIRLLQTFLGLDERRLHRAFGGAVIDVFVDVKDITVANL